MALYRSIFVYKPGRPEVKIRARAEIGAQKMADIRVRVPQLLIRALEILLASSFLLVIRRLLQEL